MKGLGPILRSGVHEGIEWEIRMGTTAPCGYVLLPEEHPWRELSITSEDHAAVDFERSMTYGADDDGRIGFDTDQVGDDWLDFEITTPRHYPTRTMWTFDYLENTIKRLADLVVATENDPVQIARAAVARMRWDHPKSLLIAAALLATAAQATTTRSRKE